MPTRTAGLRVVILNEPFYVESDRDGVCIRHRQWSLMGCGHDAGEALVDLVAMAREIEDCIRVVSPLAGVSPEYRRLMVFGRRLCRH